MMGRLNDTSGDNSRVAKKLNSEMVAEIRRRYEAGEATVKELASEYGVTNQYMSKVVSYKSWVPKEIRGY